MTGNLCRHLCDPPTGGRAYQLEGAHGDGCTDDEADRFSHDGALPFFFRILITSKTASVAAINTGTNTSVHALFMLGVSFRCRFVTRLLAPTHGS